MRWSVTRLGRWPWSPTLTALQSASRLSVNVAARRRHLSNDPAAFAGLGTGNLTATLVSNVTNGSVTLNS